MSHQFNQVEAVAESGDIVDPRWEEFRLERKIYQEDLSDLRTDNEALKLKNMGLELVKDQTTQHLNGAIQTGFVLHCQLSENRLKLASCQKELLHQNFCISVLTLTSVFLYLSRKEAMNLITDLNHEIGDLRSQISQYEQVLGTGERPTSHNQLDST
ncbi:hypothetical protein MIND_01130300 [Mycena indigotica]|uniref:Uncharacterized protein n=1 Tax=Mycena indigotica TaxID=2126181 RepID=A0A8H6S7B9_9AGAR|nr:uncharacterized protein MIND_01130300 [Mycena indigotica]KAF7293520.1 hypothetical protein MIND_01130300 [Mycena indigotica]